MKYLFLILLTFFSLLVYSQSEKKCTVRSSINVNYTNDEGSYDLQFSCSMFLSGVEPCATGDTIKIELSQQKETSIHWSFYDDFNGWYFNNCDSVQWYYNGTMLDNESYLLNDTVVSGSCGLALKAWSSIDTVELGHYELRAVGDSNGLIKTNFPVIHIYEKQNDLEEGEGISANVINIYPNPILNSVIVSLNEQLLIGEIVVHDLSGRLITKREINNTLKKEFDFSQLNQGIYIFSIVNLSNGKTLFRKKMKR